MSDAPQEPITLLITLNMTSGEVEVNGPLQNEMLVYGMLEKARQITSDYARRNATPVIVGARSMPFPRSVQ